MADVSKWRTGDQIRRVKRQLLNEIVAGDKAKDRHITLSIVAARNLLEVCDQAIHTEDAQMEGVSIS